MRLAARLSVVTGTQILVSVLMQWYIVARFGAGVEADALYAGSIFAQVTRALVFDSVRLVMTPLLTEKSEPQLREAGWSSFCFLSVAGVLACIVMYVAAPVLTPLIVPGFSQSSRTLTTQLARIQLMGIMGSAAYSVFATLCVVRGQFMRPPLANLSSGLICCFLLAVMPHPWTIVKAGWIMTMYTILPGVLLAPNLGKPVRIRWNAPDARRLWSQLRPLIAGRAYFLTSTPLDRLLLSFLPSGTLALYEIAGRISTAILSILDFALLTPALPRLARLAEKEKWQEFRALAIRKATESCIVSFGLLVAVYAGLTACRVALSGGRIPLLLGRFTAHDFSYIGLLILYMSASLPFASVLQVLSAAYCARRKTGMLTKISAIVYTIAVPVRIGMFFLANVAGLALTSAVVGAGYCISLWRNLHPESKGILVQAAAASDPS